MLEWSWLWWGVLFVGWGHGGVCAVCWCCVRVSARLGALAFPLLPHTIHAPTHPPCRALNATQLMLQGDRELQTSLGKAMNRGKEAYTVSFDNKTSPPVATGGWPANNAPIQASYEVGRGVVSGFDGVIWFLSFVARLGSKHC